jgi:hypothetical protein
LKRTHTNEIKRSEESKMSTKKIQMIDNKVVLNGIKLLSKDTYKYASTRLPDLLATVHKLIVNRQ